MYTDIYSLYVYIHLTCDEMYYSHQLPDFMFARNNGGVLKYF